MTTTAYPHVLLADGGMAYIAGTQVKVVEIVMDKLAHQWDAEHIHEQYPELSLSQIHSSLAFYYDHQEQLDREIEQRLRAEDKLVQQMGVSALRLRLQEARRKS